MYRKNDYNNSGDWITGPFFLDIFLYLVFATKYHTSSLSLSLLLCKMGLIMPALQRAWAVQRQYLKVPVIRPFSYLMNGYKSVVCSCQ